MAAKEIFLSYGREREVIYFVKKLKMDLEREGFSVWLDCDDIMAGSDWHGAIGTGLSCSKAIVPIITNKYVASHFCKGELYTADCEKKLIFPLFLEDVDLSVSELARGVKYIISGINWTYFWPGLDYDMSLKKLVEGMKDKGLGKAVNDVDCGEANLSSQMEQLHFSPSAPPPAGIPYPSPPQQTFSSYGYYHSPPPPVPQPYYNQTSPNLGYPPPHNPPPHNAAYPPPQNPAYPMNPYYSPQPISPYYQPVTGAYQSPPPAGYAYPMAPAVLTSQDHMEPPPPYLNSEEQYREPVTDVQKPHFKVGMKLEAVDQRFPYFVCVATIMDRNENDLLIHFDGWGENYNYWCSCEDIELHPVGWCEKHGWDLQPPHNQLWENWSAYLKKNHAEKVPDELFNKNQLAGPGSLLFSPGMKIEAKDRKYPTLICAASIVEICPGEVKVHFDGWSAEYDYWCLSSSNDIHPPMWSGKQLKKQVQAPKGYGRAFKWSEYLIDPDNRPAPAHLFTEAQRSAHPGDAEFTVNMRLEAKDRLNPSLIAVATIASIKDGQLLIHFDGWTTRYDYWCKPDCIDIHPKGWCKRNGKTLQPPHNHGEDFSWNRYLRSIGAIAAPDNLFTTDQKGTIRFEVGMKLEAKDRKNPSLICVATVSDINSTGKLYIHFDGWSTNYDYWCDPSSADIHPMGWCETHDKDLQAPYGMDAHFDWSDYLEDVGGTAAPKELFTAAQR